MILRYSPFAREAIRRLHPDIKKGIKQTLESLQNEPHRGKPLQRDLVGFWSLHFKRYRIIYEIQEREIGILAIGHRSTIYSDFSKQIKQVH